MQIETEEIEPTYFGKETQTAMRLPIKNSHPHAGAVTALIAGLSLM